MFESCSLSGSGLDQGTCSPIDFFCGRLKRLKQINSQSFHSRRVSFIVTMKPSGVRVDEFTVTINETRYESKLWLFICFRRLARPLKKPIRLQLP
jgi:hypothetical protein